MKSSRTAALVLGAFAVLAGLVLYPSIRHAVAKGDFAGAPPRSGYFTLRPVGSYASLPDDAAAAAEVHRSSWEPREDNTAYNNTFPHSLRLRPAKQADHSYDPRWNTYILKRITGNYAGTTDEIFQWAAAKWGVPDNLLRAIAYMESGWNQSNYGDFVRNGAECLPGYRKLPCPVTFGIVGVKSTSWHGIFPWNHDSTAAAVDVLGGWLRGCYEGWVWWLRAHGNRSHGTYKAGDIWGCVGAWYSGNWYDGSPNHQQSGQGYIYWTKHWEEVEPWLSRSFGF
ncbi:MAG TPA: hypothetical protein VFQ44_21555 [Streptosporangiaceae bacterium]|nr:hypothetical protein [Streptosporangiaceae bacterium]